MKCSFCGTEIQRGTGKMFIENNGTIYYWCSKKCEKNQTMGRSKTKLKWARSAK